MARSEKAGLTEGAEVTVASSRLSGESVKTVTIRCSECGAEVDRVEWREYSGPPPAVTAVMGALDVDEKTARKIVADQNPSALLDPRENAEALTADIIGRNVADRDAATYACPNGHDAPLEVAK
jgi:hypothetical protein